MCMNVATCSSLLWLHDVMVFDSYNAANKTALML